MQKKMSKRRWKKKVSVILVGALVIITLLSSCGITKDKVQIVVQMFGGPEARAMLPTVEYWNKKYADMTGIYVKQVTISRTGYFEKLSSQLVSGVPIPDIIHPFSYSVGKFSPYLLPLDNYMSNPQLFSSPQGKPYDKNWMFPVALKLGQYKGKQYYLGKDMSEVILYYRKDLIPNPPNTWEELLDIARKFTRSHNPSSPTLYGTAWQGKYEMWNFVAFHEILWSYGGEYFKKDSYEPNLDSPEAIKAANIIYRMGREKLVPPDSTQYEYPEILSALQTGLVAVCPQWNAAYADLTSPDKSPLVYDKIAIAPPPGVRQPDGTIKRTMLVHTINFAINKASRHPREAFKFLAWACFGEGAKLYAENGGSSPLFKVWANGPEPLPTMIPWVKEYARAYIPFPDISEVIMMGSKHLQSILAGMTPEKGMKSLNDEIKRFLKERPGYFSNGHWLAR